MGNKKVLETCIACGNKQATKRHARLADCIPFICDKCRCADCQIVLSSELCFCGQRHGEPSSEYPYLCKVCVEIRYRTASLESDEIRLRMQDLQLEPPL